MEASEAIQITDLIDERDAAKILCISPGTLSVWRSRRRYPLPYVKLGHSVRYSRAAVLKFIADRAVVPLDPKSPYPSKPRKRPVATKAAKKSRSSAGRE
jgi:hypothetical protein